MDRDQIQRLYAQHAHAITRQIEDAKRSRREVDQGLFRAMRARRQEIEGWAPDRPREL